MDISALVPLQDLGFGRRAARLAVQCVFRALFGEEKAQACAIA
jgi:hypothetical protein